MNTRVQKWGNSLAIRLPSKLASALGMHAHSVIRLEVIDGKLVATPVAGKLSLPELLAGIHDGNLHSPVDTGEPVGREEW